MPQTSRISSNNTKNFSPPRIWAFSAPHIWTLELYGNRIVHVDKTSRICTVSHCDYPTRTTQRRLTQFFRENDIRNASVYIQKGEMFLRLNGADIKMNPAASFTLSGAEIETLFGKV